MTPKLAALLTLMIRKPWRPAWLLGQMMWPDRPDTGPSGGGPSKLAVAMSYWLGKLERQDIVTGRLMTDSDTQRKWSATQKGRDLLAAYEAEHLRRALKQPDNDSGGYRQ